ncbi:electron transfer flavoprotein subunit alpha/FixB family protein [Paenibacillus lutrae]|uniref:Electron transfer flavoprotein subunit alpha/FixB family protein n=1 Tax=Paenibacillus lutrae TaxID=2078573 RepID=A0A7X3FMR8_9BACL|nr:electron transfer flavoprotein subunit alpha/FixB family protein [Paenibacillus lutrae]MVP02505.1 electron transfer flavoprotein subunit alpha/FixB family protein [Paenibacillus lutrae]
MSHSYLVVAESKGGLLRQVSFETIAAAKTAAEDGDHVAAVLIGSGLSSLAGELISHGADKVYVVDHAGLANYNPEAYSKALQSVIGAALPDALLFGHTAIGKDLAPRTAAILGAGQISDITGVEQKDGRAVFTRPIYAGKAIEKKAFTSFPWVVTVRPSNIAVQEAQEDRSGEVVNIAYEAPSLRTVILEVVRKTSGKIDLAEAKVVISGGRGVKSPGGFKPLEELAGVLGGAVGASRGACDAGYCDYALQIGQTGKVVTPEIYIACGISGAIQHLAGMSGSRVIIAINKDPEAPIFKVADYGIVGDLFEVVPLLTEEFRKAL